MELEAARALLVSGKPHFLPADSIALDLDPVLTVMADSRAGKQAAWHKEITSPFDLTVRTPVAVYRMWGALRFFIVRGDSARLPEDLVSRGFPRDSLRWYVERWEEGLGPSLPARIVPSRALPNRTFTWGRLKTIYLLELPVLARR